MFSWLNGYSPSFSTKVTRCSNPTHPPSKQFFVFLRFFRLESNISPYFSPFHAKFFQRGREVNSQRRSSIEEQEKREKCVFRGISRTSKEGEVVEKREVNGGEIEEKKKIDKEPDIEARPLDFRHQLEIVDDDEVQRKWYLSPYYVVRRALVFPPLLTLWSRIRSSMYSN